MNNLPSKISQAIKEADIAASVLSAGEVPPLAIMRNHQRILTSLLAEMAQGMKDTKRTELGTYVTRRRKQAERFTKCRKQNGMTSKDAEEESKIFVKAEEADEIEAEAQMTYMEVLLSALKYKISFVQDVANDAKSIEKMFTRSPTN